MINNATGAGSTVLWEFALMHMITAEVPPMRRATLTCGGSRRDQFRPEVGDHLVARMLATPANTADATFGTPLTQAAEKAIEHDQGAFFVCMRDYPEVEQQLGSIVLGEKREARGR